ncbi:MAG: DUF952 domain-containing protein [Balneolaceae bacterium]|nr:DUF952 domain-containing protein [Balneolaceae bacterium]
MRDDLIFLLVSKQDWDLSKNNSTYEPQSIEEHGFINSLKGDQIEEEANERFGESDDPLLVVINTSLLQPKLKYEEDPEKGRVVPRIYGPLNLDAVIDKIPLAAEPDGSYDIAFTEN